jgi:hygromycin-B 7''-O-kinase
MASLLPNLPSPAEYRGVHTDGSVWLPAVAAICRRHGLDANNLERQAAGTHVVFRSGSRMVKLYAPFWLEDFTAEHAALQPLRGLPTPELVAQGEIEGWPYLVMTVVPGVPAEEIWPDLTDADRIDLARQLGRLMRRLHLQDPVAELATDWDAFLGERISGAEEFHAAGEPWHAWIRRRLTGFQEPPFSPVLLHADITADHALLSRTAQGWRITGLIDFGDAMMGHPFYEFIAPLAFYGFGDPPVSKALLEGYGLDLTPEVADRLTTYCLLHKFGRIGVFLARHPAADGAAFHRALWG